MVHWAASYFVCTIVCLADPTRRLTEGADRSYFDEFETLVLFISVVGVNWAIADGRTNWLEGLVLMVIYVIIALVRCQRSSPTARH